MTEASRSQPINGHTELPWSVGANGRSIVREVPGMSDGFDHYMVAVLSAHSLLPAHEASANAALIVEAVNNYESLKARVAELEDQMESIRQYGSDTLSGRADGPDDREWQREAVREMRNRALSALNLEKPKD